MKRFIKDNKIKLQKDIVLDTVIDGVDYKIYNPSEEMLIEYGWIEYVIPEPSVEQKLANAKNRKIREVENYDTSDEVNLFYINDVACWLDKNTRVGLMLRFDSEIAAGNTDTSLWYKGVSFPLSLSQAKQMLYALEIYASKCYDNTQYHISSINELTSEDDVVNYDYTLGYPDKIRF